VVQQMARLAHPGIVGVVAKHQSWQGFHYFVMEYLDGGDLRRAVLDKAVAPEKIPGVLRRAGEALAWLHAQGLVHRSARPANVVLTGEGDVRLTDVDMQRVVDASHTPRPADPRADLALFATTALFALSGRRPSREMLQDPYRAVNDLPCSDALKDVLRHAFDPDTSKRTPSMAAFCDELALASPPDEPVATTAETAHGEVTAPRARVRRAALAWGVVLLVVLVAVGVLVARR
jgi:serine/threonine protein kinase